MWLPASTQHLVENSNFLFGMIWETAMQQKEHYATESSIMLYE